MLSDTHICRRFMHSVLQWVGCRQLLGREKRILERKPGIRPTDRQSRLIFVFGLEKSPPDQLPNCHEQVGEFGYFSVRLVHTWLVVLHSKPDPLFVKNVAGSSGNAWSVDGSRGLLRRASRLRCSSANLPHRPQIELRI